MARLTQIAARATAAGVLAILPALLAGPACVLRLDERNQVDLNGAVSGIAVDCSTVTPEAKGVVDGAAEVKFVGRYDLRDPARPVFDYSGNVINARFMGTEVSVGLDSNDTRSVDSVGGNLLFEVVIDDQAPRVIVVTPSQPRYVLATGLDGSVSHQVTLHRNTEAQKGPVAFTGFDFGAGGSLLPPIRRARRIEMIGDSITCGYGDEGLHATCPFDVPDPGKTEFKTPLTENQYLAYGSIVGRVFDADVVTVCWSGKGVVYNYKENPTDRDRLVTIPQLWEERTLGGYGPDVRGVAWDFAKEPDVQVVVVNLGVNDFSRDVLPPAAPAQPGKPANLSGDNIPDGNVDIDLFKKGYLAFVQQIRTRRPKAHIFLTVPPMITDEYPIQNGRNLMRESLKFVADDFAGRGDPKVYYMDLVNMGTRYGLGCDYHPNLDVHQLMADQLTGAIRTKTCW